MHTTLSAQLQTKIAKQNTATDEYPFYPKLGILGTVAGTLAALYLMPDNPFPAGALYSSALAMSIGLAFAPVRAAIRQPRTLLRAEHLLVLSPIYWLLLDLLQGTYSFTFVDRTAIQSAFLAIGLFVFGIWIAALAKPWLLPKAVIKAATLPLEPGTVFRLTIILFGLGIFKYAYPTGFNPIQMLYYLGVNRWSAPWARGALGGWSAFLDHMSYFGFLLPALTVLLAQRSRWFSPKTILAIVLSLVMVAFLAQGGGRRVVGVVLGAAIIVWILEQERFKVYQILVVVISASLLLLGMQNMLEYRSSGFQSLFTGSSTSQYDHLYVDDNFLRLSQIIYIIPKYHQFVHAQQIIYTLVYPIPRVFWPGKPTGPGFDLTAALGQSGFSLTSTVIGEWYFSYGWFSIFIGGWLYGKLAHAFTMLLTGPQRSAKSLVYSLAAMMLFAGMRSMLELVGMSYALLAWVFITNFIADQSKEFAVKQ